MTWTALPAGTSASIGVEEANELLMPVALHVAADDGAVEDVERGEQRRGAVPFVVMRHGAEPPLLQRQARLGAIERLNLALFVDRKHDGVGGRIDIEPDDVAQLVDEVWIVRELELPDAMRLKPVRAPDALDGAGADAARLRHQSRGPVRCLHGGSASVSATTRAATSSPSGWMREGRVLSRRSPSKPCCAKRSCQRQTQVFDLSVRRMISIVPRPSAVRE